jgi:hypothetical protein
MKEFVIGLAILAAMPWLINLGVEYVGWVKQVMQ